MSEDRCPILGRFVQEYSAQQKLGQQFYYDVDATLAGFFEVDDVRAHSRKEQLLRAWYCLDVIWWNSMREYYTHEDKFPIRRSREQLNGLIKNAKEIEKDYVVKGIELSFNISAGSSAANAAFVKDKWKRSAESSLFVLQVLEFFRPKLRNDESLARMGSYVAKTLAFCRQESDEYIKHARNLANITEEHAIIWTP